MKAAAPSPEQRERDGRLAWIIVSICAVLSVTLILLAVRALSGPAARWAEEAMREQREAAAARDRAMGDLYPGVPVPPAPPAPPSLETARPIGSVAGWIGADDYPTGALRRGEEGRVRVTVSIDEAGQATGCSTHESSGFASLDAGTCHVMMSNGRWNRAESGDTGVRRWTSPAVRWVLPE